MNHVWAWMLGFSAEQEFSIWSILIACGLTLVNILISMQLSLGMHKTLLTATLRQVNLQKSKKLLRARNPIYMACATAYKVCNLWL